MALPNSPIIIGYGRVRWGTLCETLNMSMRPVLDSAGRMVKWVEYNYTLKFVVGEDNQEVGMSADLTLADLRSDLQANGLEMHFLNTGYGGLQHAPLDGTTFGLPTNSHDICFGPIPTVMLWQPHGNQSATCQASFLIRLASCPEDAFYDDGIVEYCWSVAYNVDRSGLTNRVTSGKARVVGLKPTPTSRQIHDQGDRLRERINPPLLPNFRRIPGGFSLDEGKTVLTFNVTDEQLPSPNPPPPKCVDVDATHTLSTDSLYGGKFRGTLSATYEIASDTQRSAAESMFFDLAQDRIARSNKKPFNDFFGKAQQTSVIYRGYEVSEPLYDRKAATFRLDYQLICSVPFLLQNSGLWRPVPNTDWGRWSTSLANTAFNCRGSAGLRFDSSMESLIDICEQPEIPRLVRGGPRGPIPGGRLVRDPGGRLRNETPPGPTSWITYFCWLKLETIDEVIELKPLPIGPGLNGGKRPGGQMEQIIGGPGSPVRNLRTVPGDVGDPLGGYTKAGFRGSNVEPIASAPRPISASPGFPTSPNPGAIMAGNPIIQRRAPSTYIAYLEGFAARAGHPIRPPSLVSVGGAAAVPANRASDGFSMGAVASWGGCPIYLARFRLRYLLASVPAGELPIMGNPFMGL